MDKVQYFFDSLWDDLDECANFVVNVVKGHEPRQLSPVDRRMFQTLKKYLTDEDAVKAFDRALRSVALGTLTSIMATIDGSTQLSDYIRIQIIDSDTGEEIHVPYNDKFAAFVWELEKSEKL